MKPKFFTSLLIWFYLFQNSVFAQKENYVWYFGDRAGLDFNSGTPVALTNSAMNIFEGCSTISDANGNLLFYTSGAEVWDRNHNPMPNGTALLGGPSATQAALIVPYPGNNILYYIFTVQDFLTFTTLNFRYSIVDMSLNGGNGDVTIKNSFILNPITEKLTAVKQSNGTDYWVMVHGVNNNNFYCYAMTSAGLDTTPVISSIGPIIPNFLINLDIEGYMKFSLDGSKIAYAANGTTAYIDIFDFNASTGIVSNEKYLNLPFSPNSGAYGLEFSASGNYLYSTLSASKTLYQWDISSGSAVVINATRQLIDSIDAQYGGALQLGPDGKIYAARTYADFLGVINFPELPGIQCNYNDSGVSLNGKTSLAGLPNFITSNFLTTGIKSNNPKQNELTIYPNPATDKIFISYPALFSQTITTKIFSITGEVIFKEEDKTASIYFNKTIDVTGYANGIYFLNLQAADNVITKKIIISH